MIAVTSGVGAYLLGLSVPVSIAVGILAPMAVAAVPRFLLGTVVGARTASPREDVAAAMSGTEFEEYIARIARSCGVSVIMTSLSGDWGVDLILGHRPNRVAVQCKRRSRPVGPGAVQEVVAGAAMHACSQTMVVTNHEFTAAAYKLAERHGCVLVGGTDLPRLRSIVRRLTAPTTEAR
jgi:restriction system protein